MSGSGPTFRRSPQRSTTPGGAPASRPRSTRCPASGGTRSSTGGSSSTTARTPRASPAAANLNIRVVDGLVSNWAQAVSVGGEIRIKRGLSPAERVSALAHELAHEVLHQGAANRKRPLEIPHAVAETEAEAVSYVVLKNLGLPSKAPAYIAWRGGSGDTVLKSMTRIHRAVKAILTAATDARAGKKKA